MTEILEPQGLKRFSAVLVKIWERGLAWFMRRIKREFLVPSTAPTRMLSKVRVKLEHVLFRMRSRCPRRDVLYFFFDLEVCPITYDFVTYLSTAEVRRRQLGLASIHVVVVPGTFMGLREEIPEYDAAVGVEARRWRLHNFLIPLFRLLPSCTGYTICGTRRDAFEGIFLDAEHVFPEGYNVNAPVAPNTRDICDAARAGQEVLPMLRATPQGLAYMRRCLESRALGRRVIVINLRRYAFMPARNSSYGNWVAFARELDVTRWMPVFVLDTDVALDPLLPELDEFEVCHAVPWNIELRMALYELADLTMAIAQGPMELCWLNHRCRYAFFVAPGSSPQSTDKALVAHGFDVGKDPPYAVSGQRWIWTSDDLPILRSVFAEMTSNDALRT